MEDTRTLDTETGQERWGSDKSSSTASQLREKASEVANRAKDKVQEWSDTAAAKIDQQRESAAGALDSTAGKLHDAANAGAQKISTAVHSAAEGVQSTATYLREHDTRQMLSDLEDVVRRRPGQSLLIAAAVGFLVGRALRND
jgi:ElaB/YqjD/DUF883 family membrane-anchored ribosome-binding protein